ncbi:hypothetical protein D3C86_1814570 [compost metagenome]
MITALSTAKKYGRRRLFWFKVVSSSLFLYDMAKQQSEQYHSVQTVSVQLKIGHADKGERCEKVFFDSIRYGE